MKKMIILTVCFVIVCVIVSIPLTIKTKSMVNKNIPIQESSLYSLTYVVKNFNGNIAVFEYGYNEPFRVTEISVKDLPVADQELLDMGIMANNIEELNVILEDYCS